MLLASNLLGKMPPALTTPAPGGSGNPASRGKGFASPEGVAQHTQGRDSPGTSGSEIPWHWPNPSSRSET